MATFKYNIDTVLTEILTYIIKSGDIERIIDYQGYYLYKMPNLEIRDIKTGSPIITFYNKTFTVDRDKGLYFTKLLEAEYALSLSKTINKKQLKEIMSKVK